MTEKNPTAENPQAESPETPTQINSEETQEKATPEIEVVTEEPAAEPEIQETMDTAAEPEVLEPLEEPAPEPVTEEVLVAEETEIPAPETAAEEPVVAEAAEEPASEVTAEEPVVAEAAEEPASEAAAEEPVVAEAAEEPASEVTAEEPVVAEVAEEPVSEAVAEEPVIVEKDEKSIVAEVADEHKDHDRADNDDEKLMREINNIGTSSSEIDEEAEEEEADLTEEPEEVLEKYDEYDREKLVEILEETVKEENVQRIKTRVAMIKVAFLKLSKDFRQQKLDEHISGGGTRENYTPGPDPLMEKFDQVFEVYKKNKARYNEHQEVIKLRNLEAKQAILEELKELINSDETLKKTYDQFKDLQAKWKEIGLVPSTEINNLWQNYHFLVEKFFDKVKINRELRDLDLKKNLEKKMELCEKAEELLIEPSVVKSFQQLQKYHEEWKEIGPVPQDKRDEIWERFKTATDKINERRREHYNILSQDQEKNLAEKTALCEKAEQIAAMEIDSLKDWQDRTREVNELFKAWKTIGPAPKKDNDEIWERFKTYLNLFFSNKKEYFSRLKQEQVNNFNLKLDIVKQAEALKDSTDWKKTTQELINLQKEWKEIGPVPRKHSDKIWKRFRAACDEFFNNKSKHFSGVVESEKDNLEKKLALIQSIEEWTASKDKQANLEVLKGFQREFMEIGHVPIKDKNRVHDAFRQAINKHLDELNISSYEMRMGGGEYRQRQDSGHEGPGGDGRYGRRGGGDSSPLGTKIAKLREEIMLWENNIGFLAHSKKADLLRQEFEKKIQDAKYELAQLEAKLKSMQD